MLWSGMSKVIPKGEPTSCLSTMSWAMRLAFCMWLGIRRSYKFIQSFQVDMVRHCPSDSKQCISSISRISWSIKSIFSIWWGIHKNMYLIQSIQMVLVRWDRRAFTFQLMCLSKVIPNIESGIREDWSELWCWFFAYG